MYGEVFFFLWTAVFKPGFIFFQLFHKHPPLYEHSQKTWYVILAKGCMAVLQRDRREKKKEERLKKGISNALLKSSFCLWTVHLSSAF